MQWLSCHTVGMVTVRIHFNFSTQNNSSSLNFYLNLVFWKALNNDSQPVVHFEWDRVDFVRNDILLIVVGIFFLIYYFLFCSHRLCHYWGKPRCCCHSPDSRWCLIFVVIYFWYALVLVAIRCCYGAPLLLSIKYHPVVILRYLDWSPLPFSMVIGVVKRVC